jgi:hypothetical protein
VSVLEHGVGNMRWVGSNGDGLVITKLEGPIRGGIGQQSAATWHVWVVDGGDVAHPWLSVGAGCQLAVRPCTSEISSNLSHSSWTFGRVNSLDRQPVVMDSGTVTGCWCGFQAVREMAAV